MRWSIMSGGSAKEALLLLACFGAAVLSACAKPDASKINNPETLWIEGEKLYQDDFFEESRAFYQKIKTRFPESPRYYDAELRIADTYFAEGKYILAAEHYNDFAKTHPAHERVPYAIYRSGASYVKDSPSTIDRDQTSVEKGLAAFNRLLVDYPTAPEANLAQAEAAKLRRRLAERILYIGRFYFRKDHYEAAIGRFRQLILFYPDETELVEEGYYKMIKSYLRLKKPVEAGAAYREFKERMPNSSYVRKFDERDFN